VLDVSLVPVILDAVRMPAKDAGAPLCIPQKKQIRVGRHAAAIEIN